jgi:hypothetical protein
MTARPARCRRSICAVAVDEQQYAGGTGPCLSAMREQERVSVPDFDHETRWPQVTAEGRRVGIHSSLSLPLHGDGQVLGALNLYGEAAGAFGQDSHRAADAFAQQAVVILRFLNQLDVERAQHAQERAVAAELQRSLLPTLPDIDGIDAAARYLVSGSAAQVGGDWYDLFALPDGVIGVAIGDVMGHDVTAAASMGQLRSVLRSYAYEGSSPSIVLDRMDRLVQGFEMAALATAIYGRLIIDRGEGLFLFCNAGHLPPLVRHVDGSVQRLERGPITSSVPCLPGNRSGGKRPSPCPLGPSCCCTPTAWSRPTPAASTTASTSCRVSSPPRHRSRHRHRSATPSSPRWSARTPRTTSPCWPSASTPASRTTGRQPAARGDHGDDQTVVPHPFFCPSQ